MHKRYTIRWSRKREVATQIKVIAASEILVQLLSLPTLNLCFYSFQRLASEMSLFQAETTYSDTGKHC